MARRNNTIFLVYVWSLLSGYLSFLAPNIFYLLNILKAVIKPHSEVLFSPYKWEPKDKNNTMSQSTQRKICDKSGNQISVSQILQ